MAGRLEGKTALVTGAGSIGPGWGNGKAISVLFAREGASVFAVDRDIAAAGETRKLIEDEGGTCVTHGADVSKGAEVAAMAEACEDAFGRIDVLVNNVGIVVLGGVVDLEEADWDKANDVNLKSVFLTTKHVLPRMERQGGGAIVNISSIAALRWLGIDYASYYASKAGMLGLSRSIALNYAARGIRSNCVLPGLMNTPLVKAGLTSAYGEEGDFDNLVAVRSAQCPMGHMGDAWDVAHAVLFLASDEAKYITGTELVVDGGITASVG